MRKTLVYISGPMSTGGGDLATNIYKGALVAKHLIQCGFSVICPHYNGLLKYLTPAWPDQQHQTAVQYGYEEAVSQDLRSVEAADVVYRMPGSSKGTDTEVQYANEINRPVFRDLGFLYMTRGHEAYNHEKYRGLQELQLKLEAEAVYEPKVDWPGKHEGKEALKVRLAHSVAFKGGEWPENGSVPLGETKEVAGVKRDISITGGVKDSQEGRGDFSLLPYEPQRQLAEHLRFGAAKYTRNNWRKGIGVARLVSAIRRHAGQLGEDNSENHLAAILAEASFAVQIIKDIKDGKLPRELDDVDGPFRALDWKTY